jgi:hypothetical protein
MEIILIVLAAAAVAVILILVFLGKSKNKYIMENEILAQFKKRKESALWAVARVVEARAGTVGETGEKARLSLTLEVTPPGKDAYRAHTYWLVDLAAMASFSAGSEIQVKIDVMDPKIIYPGSEQASYIPG